MPLPEHADGYGLPLTELAAKNSHLAWERRWTAVLLDHPYYPEELYLNNFSQFMSHRSQCRALLAGTDALRLDQWRSYATRWETVGIGPEMFALLFALLPGAIASAQRRAKALDEEETLAARLHFLQLDTCHWDLKGHTLVPEQWTDLPYLFQKLGAAQAVARFLTKDCGLLAY